MMLVVIIDCINCNQMKYIVIIEDLVEFVYMGCQCIIFYCEVGEYIDSFCEGFKVVICQDVDVIFVGELCDLEIILFVIMVVEMGLFVFGMLYMNSVFKIVDCLIDVFFFDEQVQVCFLFFELLVVVVVQLLLLIVDGKGCVVVYEILLCVKGFGNIICEGNMLMILLVIQGGCGFGMQVMDDVFFECVKSGKIIGEDVFCKVID